MKAVLSAFVGCAAILAAPPTLAGDLTVFSVTAPANAYGNANILLPGSGRYLIEFSGLPTSRLAIEGSYEVEWDTYLGEGCTGYCYIDGNESDARENFGGVGGKQSFLFVVPEWFYSATPVGPGNPYGVPPETLIIYEEIYINPRLDMFTEDLAEVADFAPTFTLTVKQLGAVPEPSAWALMILGFGASGAFLRRRQLARR